MKSKVRAMETRLLEKYWKRFGGTMFTEVCVGKCARRAPKRIDGVRLSGASITPMMKRYTNASRDEFQRLVSHAEKIEIIEVKRPSLNRSVIGQAIVGRFLLEADFKVNASAIVVCERRNNALQKVCKDNLQVKVWTPRRGFLV